jgi:voltage-gated potassium channel
MIKKLTVINAKNVVYFFIMNILVFGLLFINDIHKEWVYVLFGLVLVIMMFLIWLLFHLVKQITKSKEKLVTIFVCIGLPIFCVILSYSNLYHLIYELKGKTAFSSSTLHPNDFIYYSVATFTTTGFGDITSVGPISNMIAASEMLTGFTFSTVIMGVVATKIYQTETKSR